ncbi:plasma membrane-associated cation-binding protein 1, partial [Tanacetum coccineum]
MSIRTSSGYDSGAAIAEACKTYDEAKVDYSKEFEEKKAEFEAKVKEIYETATDEIK